MSLPNTFRYTVPFDGDLSVVRRLRALSSKHQEVIAGISGSVIGLNCTEDEYKDWIRGWERLKK